MRTVALFKSFHTKITFILILAMLFSAALSNFLIYRYAMASQFNQLRERLMMIAQTASLMVDADLLLKIPLARDGVNTAEYKIIAEKLATIKKKMPAITYIYTMGKSEKPNIFKFIVDPNPDDKIKKLTSYPGDEYDASRFQELTKAFNGPAADTRLGRDDWGVFISGYAPILDKGGKSVAILGLDMSANDVYNMQREVGKRAIFVLILGVIFSVLLGLLLSNTVTNPIEKLVEGTRHIASGNLAYKVKVISHDEIGELARSFNKMALDLKGYIEKLRRTTAEKERILKELEIAKGIQQSFLPESAPFIKGVEIAAKNIPAREVGGDFYDFIPIAINEWGLAVADVSGKGIPAALFMALCRTLLKASGSGNRSLKSTLAQANKLILEESKTNMFVTLFYAILDSDSMVLKYVNAGHNPPLLFRETSGDVVLLKAQGLPLGLFNNIEIEEASITLKKGDIVALYTDGVSETINEDREQFGVERLTAIIKKNRFLPAQEVIAKTLEAVRTFSGRQPQFDDMTLMVLRVLNS